MLLTMTIDPYAFLMTYLVVIIIIAVIVIVVSALIGSLINALFYLLSFSWVAKEADKRTYGALYVTSLVSTFIYLVPCAGIFLVWLYMSKRHNISYGKAFLAWLVAALISAAISVALSFIFGGFQEILLQIMNLIASYGA